MSIPALTLDSPIGALPHAKPADVRRLALLGISRVRDLLLALPFDFEEYGGPAEIGGLEAGRQATVVGVLNAIGARRTPRRRMGLTEGVLEDATGSLKLVWFNQPFVARQFHAGDKVAVAGPVREDRWGSGLEMTNPHVERLDAELAAPRRVGGLMPKYHLTRGLTSRRVAQLVEEALPLAERLEETVPDSIRRRQRLLPVADAVRAGHALATDQQWREASRRMVFAELLELQVAFLLGRRRLADERATGIPYRQEVIDAFKRGLGFELTGAQRRSIWQVFQDMEKAVPMNRLLDGDVGSGKTAVAAAAVAMAHAAGLQSVVMAPTEILARQHLGRFRAHLEGTFPGLTVELLVSGLPAAERRRVRTAAASGHTGLVVGTHALIEEEIALPALGLAVVDEQHRFGTRQRERLRAKGGSPHFLAMTATPIPRTLALALYGDMALSVIDEMPPGRLPVRTAVVGPGERDGAYELVRRGIAAGRQAFVICPLIEESELTEARAATAEFERLRADVFPGLRLALVHGRRKDKDSVMRAFAAGETDILVATAVVEVGVDVPNATVMLIEGAERFGLAQLHQFRGRVGRGAVASDCLLLSDDAGDRALQRLHLLARVHDGFKLAEEDMRLRGAGELMGPRQHGMSDLAMQALRQPALLSEVREEAEALVASDPELRSCPALRDAAQRRLESASIG
ncbi:MAG: ATP-dependent DNA helicase RecG [Candidatus Dormibacteraceae bacterium]